jgi:exonuclease 3'-5' domain-containing protein 1
MVVYKPVLVDTTDVLHDCLSVIAPLPSPSSPLPIAIDVEGINLCRDGRVCIIQLFVKGSDTVWLIDVTTLGNVAFTDVDDQGRSLRGFLQDTSVTKVSVILKFM